LKAGASKVFQEGVGEQPPRAPSAPAAPAPAAQGLPGWVIGALVAAAVAVVILLIILFSRTSPTPAPPGPQAQAPAAPAPAPAPEATAPSPAEEVKDQLQKVLSVLREAQLKKNITEFMSVYSTNFPNYEQKRASALNSWEKFDYVNLIFTVDKVQTIDPDNALAWVTWYMDIRNRDNQELAGTTQSFQVRFAKELGHWRIRDLKEGQ